MITLLGIIKHGKAVEFLECSDGYLWYIAHCISDEERYFKFRIPLEDVAGGVFPSFDLKVGYYQRWIRKELELTKESEELIAKAREEQGV